MCQAMTLVDDAFQWAVYEIWKMGSRGLFCQASKISKMSFCNLNGGREGAKRGICTDWRLQSIAPEETLPTTRLFSHFLFLDNLISFLPFTHHLLDLSFLPSLCLPKPPVLFPFLIPLFTPFIIHLFIHWLTWNDLEIIITSCSFLIDLAVFLPFRIIWAACIHTKK